ncbi:hypothetical protein GCM10009846_02800 [Agrococcus versicolor]|uniref:Transcription regulator PadR N-terminal domain-containing protein n=1 Tax=Agrococcus versicolor TaxID=501482 RepID=A0ABN3AJL1_9MICO
MTDEIQEWPAQWLRGPLALCALAVIAEHGSLHGYAIAQRLDEAGLGAIGGGTLYPLLARLERDELVTTEWLAGANGPARKVYVITAHGAQQLRQDAARWSAFATITSTVVTASQEERHR